MASSAISPRLSTTLGEAIATEVKTHPGKSGFHFLSTGTESLQCRFALIQAAEKSVDMQYYTIHNDTSANLLLEAMLKAAKRGVRIRFLVDNISMKQAGKSLSILDDVRNIEIRVFNPASTRHQSYLSRVSGFISNFRKLFKRMHNKALIADNQFAILGGRNLGDEYFEAHSDNNFKDADILAAGAIVASISHSFDSYWNGKNTFPIEALRKPVTSEKQIEKLLTELKEHWNKEAKTQDGKKLLKPDINKWLAVNEKKLIWAKAELYADNPDKIDDDAEEAQSKPYDKLENLIANAQEEVIIISPYFVPQDKGVEMLAALSKRGIKAKVLTNSLASTDVVAVHTGYRQYRKALLQNGVALYEFKAIGNKHPRQRLFGGTAPAHASLHAKLYIIDRKTVLSGSFNMDPRSESLNTEIALVIYHSTIAAQIIKMFDEAILPEVSYTLTLDKHDNIEWFAKNKNADKIYHSDPQAVFRKIEAWLMGFFPIENQL